MTKFRDSWRGVACGALCFSIFFAGHALATPSLQQASGKFDHKASITITGSSFGSKAAAAPVVWDDASGTDFSAKWDGAWPNKLPAYNTTYRAVQRGINPPHSRVNRYIAGAHAADSGYDAGWNVVFWKNVESPHYIYASWYQRADDAWVFKGDNNFKTFAYSKCCSPYEIPNNWYTAYGPPNPSTATGYAQWLFTDDGGSLMNPDMRGKNVWWNEAVNPISGQWAKVEVAVRVTGANDGYIKVWENGAVKIDYLGPTDKYPGTSRSIGIGGFARSTAQTNNWRYYTDAYVDTTLARVVLANNASLSQATIIENQIPTSWSAGSITATVNLGKFNAGQTAYLFVVDSSGAANGTGLPVTVGGTSTAKTPKPPASVVAQ